MASEGPRSGGTFANDATVGTVDWSAPSNASASDNSYATAASGLAPGDIVTKYLKATNFGFSIPGGARIDGILVEVEGKHVNDFDSDTTSGVKLVKANGSFGTENKTGGSWTTSDTYRSFGGASDLWGDTWTTEDINDADFGVGISRTIQREDGSTQTTSSIDHIRITVYYTESGGGPNWFM